MSSVQLFTLAGLVTLTASSAPPDSRPNPEGALDASFYSQPSKAAIRVLFDQNRPALYSGDGTGGPPLLLQHSVITGPVPFGKFAIFVGMADGAGGRPISGLLDANAAGRGLSTGYSPIPPISGAPAPFSAYRLSINPDDPNNRQKDMAYAMPAFWFSDISMPAEKQIIPFAMDFDSLEYRVQLRVPLAGAGTADHQSTGYVLGGLYFEQLRNLSSAPRPPAFWYGVSMFDLRKDYFKEYLTADNWSGGTQSPIVSTVPARRVVPDGGNSPVPGQAPTSTPVYAVKLDGSAELQTEPDAQVRNFGFRISRFHFQAAIDAIKRRSPEIYGDFGFTPLSDNLADYALTFFNLDAEISHKEVLAEATPARGMVVEFQNLQLIQKKAIPVEAGVHGEVTSVRDRTIEGWACFSLPAQMSHSGEAENLLGLPVPLIISAIDPQGELEEVVLARALARLPAPASNCRNGLNGHGFSVQIPLETLYLSSSASGRRKLLVKADLGSRVVPLPFAKGVMAEVPRFDFEYFGRTHVVPEKPNILGEFHGTRKGVARGWACLYASDHPMVVDLVARVEGKPDTVLATGLADTATAQDLSGAEACGDRSPHGFELTISSPERIPPGSTLEAVVYPFPSARVKWSRTLERSGAAVMEGPVLGFFEGLTKHPSGNFAGVGWACQFGDPEPLMVVLSVLMVNGESRDLLVAKANLASETQVGRSCGLAAGAASASPEAGFRYEFSLSPAQIAAIGPPSAVRRIRVHAYPEGAMNKRVLLREFASGAFTFPLP